MTTRLFKARLQFINELAARKDQGDEEEAKIGADVAGQLHAQVAAMNLENFVVRTQRKSVEKYAKPEPWQALGAEDLIELTQNVAGLPSELTDEDEEAKRFDMLVLRTQLAIMQAKPDFTSLREKIQAIASALEGQESIPAIKAQMVLIQSVAGDEWWEDMTVPMLESARKKLRALVKLIEKAKKKVVYTDFEDELGDETPIELPEVGTGMDLAKFREKARQFLRAHESLSRCKNCAAISHSLYPTLLSWSICWKRLAERRNSSTRPNSKATAWVFSSAHWSDWTEKPQNKPSANSYRYAATANQIEFVDLVVQYLTENGVMEPDRLYESPFIDISPQGPEGIFPSAKVDQMVKVLSEIAHRAAA